MAEIVPHHNSPILHREKEVPPQYQRFIPEIRAFISTYQNLLYSIAGDRSLRFEPGIGFSINLEKGTITIGAEDWEWGEKHHLTAWGRLWSIGHEIAHFKDLRQNPEAMLENFSYMRRRAKEVGAQAIPMLEAHHGKALPDSFTKQHPLGDEGETMSALEKFIYQQIHCLYNVLDDRYINQELANRSAIFREQGSQYDEIKRLYRDFLFPTDSKKHGAPPESNEPVIYADKPRTMQFANYVIRQKMVPDQEIILSNQVGAIFQGYRDTAAQAQGISFLHELDFITRPGNSKTKDPAWRYEQVREAIEPTYIDLLLEDLKDFPIPDESETPQPRDQSKSGEGQPQTLQEGNPWASFDDKPEPINIQTIRKFIQQQTKEKEKQEKTAKETAMTPEERAAKAQQEEDKKLSTQFEINDHLVKQYRKLELDVEAYKRDLSKVFEQMMNTVALQIQTLWAQGFRSGRFNIDSFIRKYGSFLAVEQPDFIPWDTLDAFDQKQFMERLSLFPEQIRLRLVLDGSSSMDEAKQKAVKELSVLFSEGLATFESTMNLRFRLTKPFIVDTEIYMFGSPGKNQKIKEFSNGKSPDEERADRMKALGFIHNEYGLTCEAEALWDIVESIDPTYEQDLKSGKAKDFVFVVTDGGSNQISQFASSSEYPFSPPMTAIEDATNAITTLHDMGVLIRGLQIDVPSEDEMLTFESIWGTMGQHVPAPKNLAPTVASMFKDEIRKTEILVEMYDDGEE